MPWRRRPCCSRRSSSSSLPPNVVSPTFLWQDYKLTGPSFINPSTTLLRVHEEDWGKTAISTAFLELAIAVEIASTAATGGPTAQPAGANPSPGAPVAAPGAGAAEEAAPLATLSDWGAAAAAARGQPSAAEGPRARRARRGGGPRARHPTRQGQMAPDPRER